MFVSTSWMRYPLLLLLLVGLVACEQEEAELATDEEVAEETAEPEWGYTGETGPENWEDLAPAYAACGGDNQSPIDLAAASNATGSPLQMDYMDAPAILAGGYEGLKAEAEGTLMIEDSTYALLQFHLHTPSEHTVDGEQYPAELHYVHQNEAGELAVVGVLFEEGSANAAVDSLLSASAGDQVSMTGLFPEGQEYYKYTGSLTTPPCTEGVRWHVLEEPISVSSEQLQQLEERVGMNARPVQPLNDRTLSSVES